MFVNANELKRTKRFKKERVSEMNFLIPGYEDYKEIMNKEYSVNNLKDLCKHYKLRLSGNKSDLKIRIHDYLYKSFFFIFPPKFSIICNSFFIKNKKQKTNYPSNKNN